jgi:galactose mutarotase-like enzyme
MTDNPLSTVTITSPDGETVAQFAPEANLVCHSLRDHGDELLHPTHGLEAYAQRGKTTGIPLLYPWANRLSGRSYDAAGRHVELPDPDGRYGLDPNGLPIHGALPSLLAWEVAPGSAPDRLSARLRWDRAELLALFPYPHEVTVEAAVASGRLSLGTTLRATGDEPVPVAFGFHPYLTIPGSDRRDWEVTLGASQRLVLDDQMIPTGGREPLTTTEFTLDDAGWDDGLAGLQTPPRFTVASDAMTLTVTFEQGFHWAQVFAPPDHDYICFEPMTAPTDALVSGDGLTVVAPGDSYATRFAIAVTR